MHLLKSAMEAPELALGLAVLLVDYYIDRNKTATRSHTKTWLAQLPHYRGWNPLIQRGRLFFQSLFKDC